MNFISDLTGSLIMFLYELVGGNYGVAIILFTILLKLLLLPLTLKAARASKIQMDLQPQVADIQKKLKDQPEQQAKALQELYKENGVSLFGGCLPLLIQIPIIFAVFTTLAQPLTYCLKYPEAKVNELVAGVTAVQYKEVVVAQDLINFNFLGINIGATPQFNLNPETLILWIFPILSGVTTYIALILAQGLKKKDEIKKPKKDKNPEDTTQDIMKSMNIITPIMSAYISFIAPIGLSIYWIFGNLFQIFQQIVLLPMYMKSDKKIKNNIEYEVIEENKEDNTKIEDKQEVKKLDASADNKNKNNKSNKKKNKKKK